MVRNTWLQRISPGKLKWLSYTFNLRNISREQFVDFFDPIVSLDAISQPLRIHSKDTNNQGQATTAPHTLSSPDNLTGAPTDAYCKLLGHALADWIGTPRNFMSNDALCRILFAGSSQRLYSLDFYMNQSRNAGEKASWDLWDPNTMEGMSRYHLRWLANRVLGDAEVVPANDGALADVAMNSAPCLHLVIKVYDEMVASTDQRNLLVCFERVETIRYVAVILRHHGIPFGAIYAGVPDATNVQDRFTTQSPLVMLYQYSALRPDANLHTLYAHTVLFEPPTDPQSYFKVKQTLQSQGQQRQVVVHWLGRHPLGLTNQFSNFVVQHNWHIAAWWTQP